MDGVTIARSTATDLAVVRELLVEYVDSLGFSLGYQDFDREFAELPGAYASPSGALLVARVDGAAAGCVAMRRLDGEICEMKRLYVRPQHRRIGGVSVGRALATSVVAEARAAGYVRMRLDTVATTMGAAIALYRSMGFVEIPPYYASPLADTMYMELIL
jgi:ribosomal protein S18 acetylase RimI-like enzyme